MLNHLRACTYAKFVRFLFLRRMRWMALHWAPVIALSLGRGKAPEFCFLTGLVFDQSVKRKFGSPLRPPFVSTETLLK